MLGFYDTGMPRWDVHMTHDDGDQWIDTYHDIHGDLVDILPLALLSGPPPAPPGTAWRQAGTSGRVGRQCRACPPCGRRGHG